MSPLYLEVEEFELFVSALPNNQELFESHTNLASSIAGYYAKKCAPFLQYEELYQWGLIGLWDACRKYTGSRDEFPFYARQRVRGHIIDEIRNSTPLKRNKRTKSGVLPRLNPIELDPNLTSSDETPVDELVHARVELKKILESLNLLGYRKALILSMYCFDDHSLREIAEHLGITEARVCQLKDKALDQLACVSSAGLDP
jgi:RNA polymerase sigma factor for flagellar operon FliA